MGKGKRKRKGNKSSGPPPEMGMGKGKGKSKRNKSSGPQPPSPSPPPSPQPLYFEYDAMPLSHKRKLYLNDDRGSINKYIELLSWIRSMACLDGTVFEDIPNSNCKNVSYSFIEVEVIAPTVSSKFVIRKTDLYLSAFRAKNKWLQYNMQGHRLSGFMDIDYPGRYICEPWKRIGPKHLIECLVELNSPSRDLDNQEDMREIVKSSQIFFVLLCEASRFYPISSFICDTLSQPNTSSEVFVKPTYEEEEVTLDDTGGDDILGFVKRFGNIDFNCSRALPNYMEKMINKHAKLSKTWYLYSLSGKKIFCPGENDSKCHIKSPKGLRCTLGVLANSNLEKVLNEWKNKLGNVRHQHHHLITSEIYAKMERNVQELKTLEMREQKRAAILKEKRASSGPSSPPRVIVLFGLSATVDLNSLEEDIRVLLSGGENSDGFPAISSSEYKLRATVLKATHNDLLTCMEMAKVADLIAFVASPKSVSEADDADNFIDSFGSQCLSVFRTLGLPSTVVLLRDLPDDLKRKTELKKIYQSMLAPEFPEDCKFYPADKKDELHKFFYLFKEQRLTVPHWRNQRSYLMAQKVDMLADNSSSDKCTLVLTGYLRAHGLSVNQLVHIAGAGDFQLSKVEWLSTCPLNVRKGMDLMDSENDIQVVRCLNPDPMKQEPLVVENVPDPLAGEQTWPTETEMLEADRNHEQKKMKKKKLPKGISEYQAAWIVDDSDVDYSDSDEAEEDGMVLDDGENAFPDHKVENGFDFDDDQASLNLRDSDEETETESVMMEGDDLTKEQIADQIRKIKEEHAEDEEFPDEVDTPLDVAARKRFAKYRGVKSFRTSLWDPKESLPLEYARIFAFDNFSRTQKHVLAKALDMEQEMDEFVPAGSYARLYIKDVPNGVASKLCMTVKKMPVIACGLLQHESKVSVLHFSIKKHDSYDAPVKAKEELLFHVGFRQFITRPIFSSDSINANKHKMERFLHAGRFSVASIYAPISFLSLPLIALKSQGEDSSPVLAAVGSLRGVDPDRIVLKRIILTGYPQRVSKVKATVRYMFHNPEDVKWFKPVEVFTKCGRRGRIKEPVGTHGAMKCIFNGVLQQHDTVCMNLFKRTYPKWPQQWFPLQSA